MRLGHLIKREKVPYAPTEVGKQTYYIITPVSEEPLAQFSIITKGQTYEMTVDNIADEVEYILDENAIKGTMISKNFDDKVSSQDIYAMLITIDMETFDFKVDSLFENPQEHQKIHFSTPSLGEEKIPYSFTNLNYDSYYAVTYGTKGKDGKFVDITGDSMFMLYTTPSEDLDGRSRPVYLRAAKSPVNSNKISFLNGKKVMWKK